MPHEFPTASLKIWSALNDYYYYYYYYYSLHSVSPAQSRKTQRGVTHRLLQGRKHCLIPKKYNLNKTNTFIKQNRYLKLLQQQYFFSLPTTVLLLAEKDCI